MGVAKTEWMDAQERGWSAPDTYVCANCVDDPYLKTLIQDNASSDTCDYCGRQDTSGDIAAEAEVVVKAIYDTVHTYYCEPASGGVPYDGGFIIDPIDISEVLDDLDFNGHPGFVEAVTGAEVNGDCFVPAADGYWGGSHRHEVLSGAWQLFSHAVKHETRFHFANTPREAESPYDIDIADVLPMIAEHLRQFICTLPAGVEVHRARIRHRGQTWQPTADQMGPPPKTLTTAGRMNPAGIPYLYTSFDKTTSRREIGVPARTSRSVFTAVFTVTSPLTVIDLTALPPLPSVFDIDNKAAREQALFVRGFVDAISIPVTKDGSEHIDYVPSQVVCEYLAQVFNAGKDIKLAGLIYPSAVQTDGKNLVVFPDDRFLGTYHGVKFLRASR
jgi:RES domain-containing protein